jgi:hypothetical protein
MQCDKCHKGADNDGQQIAKQDREQTVEKYNLSIAVNPPAEPRESQAGPWISQESFFKLV